MKHWKKNSTLIIALFAVVIGKAQNHRFEANIPVVTETDYYQIQLAPALLGTMANKATDLRVINSKEEEQAYFLTRESERSLQKEFVAYPIVKQTMVPNGTSTLVFENIGKDTISSINLLVNNADVAKKVRLSGSNDQQNWFVVKDQYFLQGFQGNNNTTLLKMLRFPSSDYQFYKLSFNDSTSLPLHINAVGYYNTKEIKSRVTSFPMEVKHLHDTLKSSYFQLSVTDTSYLERLSFYVSGPEYFDRKAEIRIKNQVNSNKKVKTPDYKMLAQFHVKSDATNEILLYNKSFKEAEFVIRNQDNTPLIVDSVVASFNNRYAVVKLETGEQYKFTWGDNKAVKPQYDLAKFASKIKPKLTVQHLRIKKMRVNNEVTVKEKAWWQSSAIIWVVIVLVGSVLGYVAFKMINEMGEK
jgi:hypothetical protein